MLGLLMFAVILLLLTFGFPVAFVYGGAALFFGLVHSGTDLFTQMPHRIWTFMNSVPLMAIPLFVYMGVILEKSGIAEKLLESMGRLFGKIHGGIAVSTIIVGTLLAASTGVVGATVVAMGVISLPVMLKHGYDKRLASGVICASGTLGQIIPPSIVLIILGQVMHLPVGNLFRAAFLPGVFLVALYIAYVLLASNLNHKLAPALTTHDSDESFSMASALWAIVPPLILILSVLGSIFIGLATPTESAGIGCVLAAAMVKLFNERDHHFSAKLFWDAAEETVKITSMVMMILIGATMFSLVFTSTGGDHIVTSYLAKLPGGAIGFLILVNLAIFILGFFIDFIEICFIVVPILLPSVHFLGIDPTWFAIIVAINLQTSFLTPPFGFSLFYLRGVAPVEVKTTDLYRGAVPFIVLQMIALGVLLIFPGWFGLGGY